MTFVRKKADITPIVDTVFPIVNKAKEDIEAVRDQIRNYLVNKLDIDVNII